MPRRSSPWGMRSAIKAVESQRWLRCELCGVMRTICSRCDRGHRYCSSACAEAARRTGKREAGRRYQSTPRGRMNNADRQRRFRQRHRQAQAPDHLSAETVTHQSSVSMPDEGASPAYEEPIITAAEPAAVTATESVAISETDACGPPCAFCGRRIPYIRNSFFLPRRRQRHRRRGPPATRRQRGPGRASPTIGP